MDEVIDCGLKFGAGNIIPAPIVMTEGSGVYVYDSSGKAYIDMMSGISVLNFGHGHPGLLKALTKQAHKISIMPRLFHNQPLAQLMQHACELTDMDKALPMNSGAEAVETAIKYCRKWACSNKGVADGQAEIIVCDNSFHGRTVTTISLSSTAKYKQGFGPLTPGFKSIPFNDVAALEQAITPNTAAFMIEPIQGEAGIIIPDDGYLSACEKLCKENNVLFILDEIQTGMGRTGKFLASQHEKIKPDGIMLGKALGGGLLPISLFLATEDLMEVVKPGEHGSTFGGNPLAACVANEALTILNDDNLPQHAVTMGSYFVKQLHGLQSNAISEIRAKGLLIAIELNESVISSQQLSKQLLQEGLITINTRNNTLRLLPPLTIQQQQIDEAINIIKNVLGN